MDKDPPAKAGDMGLISGPGRFHMPWSNEAHVPQPRSRCSGVLGNFSHFSGFGKLVGENVKL